LSYTIDILWSNIQKKYKVGPVNTSPMDFIGVCELLSNIPNLDKTKALICASFYGAIDIITTLLLEVDPSYDHNRAIRQLRRDRLKLFGCY
jgi:hypothetical protein